MNLIHVSLGGPTYIIAVGSRTYSFEDHPYCGPVVLDKRTGDPRAKQPPETDPFWQAVNRWYATGKRVGIGGRALYTGPELGTPWRGHRIAAAEGQK